MKKLLLICTVFAAMFSSMNAFAQSRIFWFDDDQPADKRLFVTECVSEKNDRKRRAPPNVINRRMSAWADYYQDSNKQCECLLQNNMTTLNLFNANGVYSLEDLMVLPSNSQKTKNIEAGLAKIDPVCGWKK